MRVVIDVNERWPIGRRWLCMLAGAGMLWLDLFALHGTSRGEVRVEGTAAAIRISTNGDRLADVLAALRAAFNVQYRSATPLDRAVTGTYSGALESVIPRLLKDYDFGCERDGIQSS
jgi:hypothetical protein